MNWLDIVLLAILAGTVLTGFFNGFLRSALGIGGMIAGLLFAPRLSSALAERLTDTVGSEATAAAIAYVAVFLAFVIGAQVLGMVLQKVAGALLLGMADRLAGAGLGIIIGGLVGLALIAALARLAVLVPETGQAQARGGALMGALVDSEVVGYYLDARSVLPGRARAFIPGDYAQAMDELEGRREQAA